MDINIDIEDGSNTKENKNQIGSYCKNEKLDKKNFFSNNSSMSILRRWNQLSRLQRYFLYILFVFGTILLLKCQQILHKTESSTITTPTIMVNPNLNNILVMERILNDDDSKIKKIIPKQEENKLSQFTGPTNERQVAVVESFKHAWKGYKEHAWGHDNLKPIAGIPYNWFSLGLTIVDALDTAFIMGLTKEYEEGKKWVQDELVFTRNKDVNFFEVTIRVLGSLLSNYHFTKDEVFLSKAEDLGQRLMAAFNTPSGIPYSDVNLATQTAHAPEWFHFSSTAEVSTVQLEFRELSRITKNSTYEKAASKVSETIHNLPKKHGLVPIFMNPNTGQFLQHTTITLGARGDSYYEYLLKQWLHMGKTVDYLVEDYLLAIEGVRDLLAKRTSPNKYLFIGELTSGSEIFNPKMDHLTCFLPGTLALGYYNGLPEWHMKMAEELMTTCYMTYATQPTFLAPEITHFNMVSATEDMYTKTADAHSLLRPEFVESLWYMYQITGNTTYQDWGWQIYQGFEKYAKVPNGYTSLANVKIDNPPPRDMMESFFLSETLKYLYLLFSEDRYLLNLNNYVVNTEAHPLPIHDA